MAGPVSEAARKDRKGKRSAGCFFTVFLLFGLGFSAFFTWPIVEIIQARSWRETPCTILASEVVRHSGSKGGTTYSVAVTFEYFVEDQRYTSSRYKFMGGSSSGQAGKQEIVNRLPPGTKTVCYVNRRDPSEAVIDRGFTSDLLFGLIPLIFVLIGAGGLVGTLVFKGAAVRTGHARPSPPSPGSAPARGAKGSLKASTSPAMRFGCVLGIAAFWNGILSFFVVGMVQDWGKGAVDGCATIFMIPFLLVGLALIGFVFYCFLGLFNPRPRLRMSGEVMLGEAFDVEWEVAGNTDRMKLFTITLEGREEATYRRGTNTSTDKSVFASIELVRISRSKEMKRGRVKAALPVGSMHSFKSKNNKFVWHLKVAGEIPRWPDVDEEFEIEVKPRRPGGAT